MRWLGWLGPVFTVARFDAPHAALTAALHVTKFIRIGIADKNDNPPYFDKALYEAEVDENEDIQHTVLTVTAKDHDEYIY
uniref:Cadherin domain-containing protein n=1 Tax=Anopheles minimus TaxID=112268 RepID=A0A182WGG5_9DIPT